MNESFEIDANHLCSYLEQQIEEFQGPLEIEKFAGGQSNPTYLLTTPKAKYVLRRKPPGKLLRGAHAVDREFRVLSALYPSKLPVAKALHLCEDDGIIGSMFYVMEFMDGRVLWDPILPDSNPTERREIYTEMNRVMSELHKVDIEKADLTTYGKSGDYFARQTHTWTKQYKAAETKNIQAIEDLIAWLGSNIPEDDAKVSVTHGDFRLDNLMFHADRNEIIAVLDWELSTIGHPYADLAYQCMQYYMPRVKGLPGLADANLEELGIPSEKEYVSMYCERMGFDDIANWNFYLAFSMFRLAAICQGVEKRSQIGTASSDKASDYGALVEPLAEIALSLTKD